MRLCTNLPCISQMTRFVTRRDVAKGLEVTYNETMGANAGRGMLQRAAQLNANVLAATYTEFDYTEFSPEAGGCWLRSVGHAAAGLGQGALGTQVTAIMAFMPCSCECCHYMEGF